MKIDPIQLQSIVDGECTNSQRRAFLEQCNGNPEHWRTLALALLEEQQFRKQFSSRPARKTCDVDSASTTKPAVALGFVSRANDVSDVGMQSQRMSWGPILAASFLAVIGFLGGRMFPSFSALPGSQDQGLIADVQVQSNDKKNPPVTLVADSDPYAGMPETDLRVRLPSSDHDIPIFNASDFDPTIALAKQELEIHRVNQRLRQQGLEIDLRPEYVTGKLQDGRHLVVPVHQVGLRQYGQ